MPTRGAQLRLFERDWLERLSHVHPLTPLALWLPLAAWLLWRAFAVHHLGAGVVAALAVASLIVWSLTEYAMHRFVFHLAPASAWRRRVQFIVHGVHHEDPGDATRLVMPPAPAALAVAVFYALFRTVLGREWVDPFFAWFLLGYLAYDYTHFAIHAWRPRTSLGRYLRRRHMLHHFATPDARWGVTSPLWDWVFGTMGEGPDTLRPARSA